MSLLVASLLGTRVASAAPAQRATVTAVHALRTVTEGQSASLAVAVTTSDRRPLGRAVAVRYATGNGTASAGSDYDAASGTLTFPAGTASGGVQRIPIITRGDDTPETAETVPVTLRATTSGVSVATQPVLVVDGHGLPYLDPRLPVDRRIADLLGRMTLDDKIGQMTQAERAAVASAPTRIAQWRLGSVLSGGGSAPAPNTPAAWLRMVNTFQQYARSTPLQIPLLYGVDAVHGHGNVYGATIFPHNVGLGSTRDPALVERVNEVTAAEVRATGIPWNFAPCICVARDERWGRTYESFSEDPALVIAMETSVDGLQGRRIGAPDRVLATVKHYAGDGDTEFGSSTTNTYTIDQGVTVTSRRDFARIDLAPYVVAIRKHRAATVMPSFSSVDWTEDGIGNPVKMHAHRELITGELKGRMGFDGFVISDWEGIHQLPDPSVPADAPRPTAAQVRVGVNAGTDMFMEPNNAPDFERLLRAEVTAGRVSQARIDDAVRRILRAKFAFGLFEQPYAPDDRVDEVGSGAHRAVARQAAAASQVLLKNTGRALPLKPDARIYVAGRNADNIGNQAGGWTMDWQGRPGRSIPGTTILQGIRQVAPQARVVHSADASAPTAGSDVGVVVVGETPYAEGFGDVGGPTWENGTPEQREAKSLTLRAADRAVVAKVCAAVPTCVVLVVSGRPQVITDQLGRIDALVASWLPGSEGTGVADVLFGRRPFTGRLSMSWPRAENQVPVNVGDRTYRPLYPYGWGLRADPGRERLTTVGARELLAPEHWQPDGTLRTDARTLALAERAVTSGESAKLRDAVLSVVRDAAQARAATGRAPVSWEAKLADADHAQITGAYEKAFSLLAAVARG
ncbi:hypothetical protein GCM10020369_50530 [Cryptosporangium minutisporangium]|uniref:beta-glucosidase n=1 Tax=Cryptosporangium minutisporangium TaxID=113569 RepID=A0ABP6T3R9_9ACTN